MTRSSFNNSSNRSIHTRYTAYAKYCLSQIQPPSLKSWRNWSYLHWHFTLHTMYKSLQITINLDDIARFLFSSWHSRCEPTLHNIRACTQNDMHDAMWSLEIQRTQRLWNSIHILLLHVVHAWTKNEFACTSHASNSPSVWMTYMQMFAPVCWACAIKKRIFTRTNCVTLMDHI